MPVLRLCSRHRTLSVGRCPQCIADRNERRRVHVSARGKKFRLAILEGMVTSVTGAASRRRRSITCELLLTGGRLWTSQTQWLLVFAATFDAARRLRTAGKVSRARGSRDLPP